MLSKVLLFFGFAFEAWYALSLQFGITGSKALLPAGLALFMLAALING